MTTFIAYIAALITMLLGLIGTVFETRRAGRLTTVGRVAVGLIVASGLVSLAARYLADEAERARLEQTDAARQESIRALTDAQKKIGQLEAALAESESREELSLLRSADVRLRATVKFERQLVFSEGRWKDRYAFLVDKGTDADPRISPEAVALCEQDMRDLCVVDYLTEPSPAAREAGDARGGAMRLSAAYTSRLWSALREGPLETRLYPPGVGLALFPPGETCTVSRDQTFQLVFKPRGDLVRSDEGAIDTTDNALPVCFPHNGSGRYWGIDREARPDTAGYMVEENPRLILELAGPDPGHGGMFVSFTYEIKIDPIARLEDLAGQILFFGVFGPPGHDEVPYECTDTKVLRPGMSVTIQADGREIAFRDLDMEFFENPWDADWRGIRTVPGKVAYDPETMWQISGFGRPCGAEVMLRFPEDKMEIVERSTSVR